MKRLAIKFGGTSVGTIEKIKKVADIVKKKHEEGNQIIVIVSAMSGFTKELVKKSNSISENFNKEELDVLLASGEQISSSLLAGAIIDLGLKARSWMGWQIPILTDTKHSSSQIIKIQSKNIIKFISDGGIAVIAGFQGVTSNDRVTTLGRGGSDLTAVAIAKFLKTDFCEIYTDVDGILTADPSMYKNAKRIEKISYEEMLEMASLGAKVMQPESVQAAMTDDISINVRSTFLEKSGTTITSEKEIDYKKVVTGIAYSKNDAKVTLVGVVDKPGVAADIFEPLGKNNINVDMVIQNISSDGKKTDITFTIKREDLSKTINFIEKNKKNLNYNKLIHDGKVSKISVIGAGMITNPGVTHKMFRSLADEKINILAISTSEIKITVLVNENFTQQAVKKLHETFELHN